MKNRWYSPTLGRFLTTDPIAENGGANTQAYCLNDPINFVDALGLDRIDARWNRYKQTFEIFYVDEWSWTGYGFTLGMGAIFGSDADPYYLGDLDLASGMLRMRNGKYADMQSVRDECDSGGTDWAAFMKRGIGRTYAESVTMGVGGDAALAGNAILRKQFAHDVLGEYYDVYDNVSIHDILTGTNMAAGLVKDLLWFYALAPLDMAQMVKASRALKYVDKVDMGSGLRSGRQRVFTATGSASFPAGWGTTDKFGNVIYSTRGTAEQVALVRFHESVHSFLSPKLEILRNFRGDLVERVYNGSAFMKYLEEALAETYAQLRVYGIRRLPTGICFPVKEGYVLLTDVIVEGAIGTVTVGGVTYGAYRVSSEMVEK